MTLILRFKGGAGSGNYNHAGRPGLVGGSTSTHMTDEQAREYGLNTNLPHYKKFPISYGDASENDRKLLGSIGYTQVPSYDDAKFQYFDEVTNPDTLVMMPDGSVIFSNPDTTTKYANQRHTLLYAGYVLSHQAEFAGQRVFNFSANEMGQDAIDVARNIIENHVDEVEDIEYHVMDATDAVSIEVDRSDGSFDNPYTVLYIKGKDSIIRPESETPPDPMRFVKQVLRLSNKGYLPPSEYVRLLMVKQVPLIKTSMLDQVKIVPDMTNNFAYDVIEKQHTSVMVGFDLSGTELGKQSTIDDPHITLVMVGDIDNVDKSLLLMQTDRFASTHAPVEAKLSGFAVFPASEENDNKAPIVALVDSPYLPAFRQALYHQLDKQFEENHGFIPHMTVGYSDKSEQTFPTKQPEFTLTLDKLTIFYGDERYTYPLSGDIVEKQLPIDDQSKSNLISVRIDIFNNTVSDLSEQMYNGQISLGQWEEAMKAEIRSLHTSTAVIGKGAWGDMTQSDWGRIGQQVRQQYRYLHNFADTVAEKRDTLSLRAIQARAQLYGNASKNTAAVAQAGEFAGGTRRQPGRFKGLPWMPGDGSTECLVNCKCHWKLDVVDTTKDWKLVQCVWTLTPAEHCNDCLDRRGHTEIIKVPADVKVPPTIGGL